MSSPHAQSAPANGSLPSGKPHGRSINPDIGFVLNVDVFLVACLAAFALATLPRLIARFRDRAEWGNGVLLRSRSRYMPNGAPGGRESSESSIRESPISEKKSSPVGSSADIDPVPELAEGVARTGPAPIRFAAYSTYVSGLAALLRRPITDNLSLGNVALAAVYIAVMIFASLWNTNPLLTPKHLGYVAASQLPVIYALGTKNNAIGWVVGLGYEKLNYLHRVSARVVVIVANLHGAGYIYKWTFTNKPVSQQLAEPKNAWGFVTLMALDILLVLGSISFVRQRCYQVFYISHILGLVFVLVGLSKHANSMRPYIWAALGIYLIDRTLRLVKTRLVVARVRPISELGITRVEIPMINSGWRPGQHVRVRVLSVGMGWLRWREAHPFTLASAPHTPQHAVLMVKRAGAWTDALYRLAGVCGPDAEKQDGDARNVCLWIEGPYGGSGNTVFHAFAGVHLVAGGSGISFPLGIVQDILRRAVEGAMNVKVIELVWCIRDAAGLSPLLPQFSDMLEQARGAGISLVVAVHYTRSSVKQDQHPEEHLRLPRGLELHPNRPDHRQTMEALMECTVSAGDPRGVIVGVCGPPSLGADVRATVGLVDPELRKAVGGVELHEEVFGW